MCPVAHSEQLPILQFLVTTTPLSLIFHQLPEPNLRSNWVTLFLTKPRGEGPHSLIWHASPPDSYISCCSALCAFYPVPLTPNTACASFYFGGISAQTFPRVEMPSLLLLSFIPQMRPALHSGPSLELWDRVKLGTGSCPSFHSCPAPYCSTYCAWLGAALGRRKWVSHNSYAPRGDFLSFVQRFR